MADRYLIETSAVDGYQTEDAAGVLILEVLPDISWFPYCPDRLNRPREIDPKRRPLQMQYDCMLPLLQDWKERITPDKWQGSRPDKLPPRKKPLQMQYDNMSILQANNLERTTPDKWLGNRPDIINRIKRSNQYSDNYPLQVISGGEVITPDKWTPSLPDFRFKKPYPYLSEIVEPGSLIKIIETGNATAIGTSTDAAITHGLVINNGDVIISIVHANYVVATPVTVTGNNGTTPFIDSINEANADAGSQYVIAYRIAGLAEPSTYHWTISSSVQWSISIRVFSGVDKTNVWEIAPSTSTRNTGTTGVTATAPAMIINDPESMGLFICITDSPTVTYSNPTNGYYGEVQPAPSITQSSWMRRWYQIGSTGTVDATLSVSNDWLAHQVALRPDTKSLLSGWQFELQQFQFRRKLPFQDTASLPLQAISGAEVLTLDKWSSPDVLIQKRKQLAKADSTFNILTTASETIFIDKWLGAYPDILNRIKRPQQFNPMFVDFSVPGVEVVTMDKWYRGQPDQLFRLKRPLLMPFDQRLDAASYLETITPDKWAPLFPDRINRILPRQQFNPMFVDFSVPSAEVVTMDKWYRGQPDQLFKLRRSLLMAFDQRLDAATYLETITPDKWTPLFSDRINRIKQRQQFNPMLLEFSVPGGGEIITIDKWLGSYPDKLNTIKRSIQHLRFSVPFDIVIAEELTLDKWYPETPDLSFNKLRHPLQMNPMLVDFSVPAAEVVTMDKWYRGQPDQLFKLRRPQLFASDMRLDAASYLERSTPDKWMPTYPDRINRIKYPQQFNQAFVEFAIPGAEAITMDKWYRGQPDQLFKLKRPLLMPFDMRDMRIIPPEVVTLDKWYQISSQPQIRSRASTHRPYLYMPMEIRVDLVTIPTDFREYLYLTGYISLKDTHIGYIALQEGLIGYITKLRSSKLII